MALISLAEVEAKSRRADQETNSRVHFFSSKFSRYFSWLFVNLGMSANSVTVCFFVVGLVGSLVMLLGTKTGVLLSYLLWRLHIIIDMSDGDVARFWNRFSINGIYWDSMTHSVLYPLYTLNMALFAFIKFDDIAFLMISGPLVLSTSLTQSVKNTYYKALFKSKQEDQSAPNQTLKLKSPTFRCIVLACSFEGLLFCFTVSGLANLNKSTYIAFFLFYLLTFIALSCFKFVNFSFKINYSKIN